MSDAANPPSAQLLIVHEQVMRPMQASVNSGITYVTSVREIARVADIFERTGRFGAAEAVRVFAQNYSIRVLELQGQIAALWRRRSWTPRVVPAIFR